MRYTDALAWLYGRQRFGVKLGLETIRALLDRLDRPEASFGALHVAGTNGKGSTCALLESVMRHAGLRVGLYTSPHLVSFRERIRVDGRTIEPDDVARGIERLRPWVEELDGRRMPATFFECTTALAFDHFRRAGVPYAVIEVGLGGRLDATNVCRPLASLITSIGLDHMERLGASVQAIAAEKAGVLRPGVPAYTTARREALDVVAREAGRRGAPLRVVRRPEPVRETLEATEFQVPFDGHPRPFRARLLGEHQAENAALALAGLDGIRREIPIPVDAAQRGIEATDWPGRLEVVDRSPLTLLDGAHNAPAMQALAEFLGRHFPDRGVAACMGTLRDKAASRMLAALAPRVSRLVLTEPPNGRALSASELAEALPPDAPPHAVVANASEAFRTLFQGGGEPVRLITGSLFLVGEARAQIKSLARDPPPKAPPLQ